MVSFHAKKKNLERITDEKFLRECETRFNHEVSNRPVIDSHKAYYQTPSILNKTFNDFDWFYNKELDLIIRKKKSGD